MSAKTFTTQPLPTGIHWDECVIARSSGRNPVTFVRSKDGTIYNVGFRGICVLGSFVCNDLDRSVYAKLAGIRVSDINAARKVRQENLRKNTRKADLLSLKAMAAKAGFKLAKVNDKAGGAA